MARAWPFQGCDDAFIDSLAVACREEEIPPNTVILKQGEVSKFMQVVSKGQVELFKEDPALGMQDGAC